MPVKNIYFLISVKSVRIWRFFLLLRILPLPYFGK
jgi:hypothetical protein